MITFLRKINRYLLYAIIGALITFAVLSDLLMITNTAAYTSGVSFTGLLIPVLIFSVLLLGLLFKLIVYISFRIDNAIFLRKSGLLYPFPIAFGDYEIIACAFLIPGILICGLIHLPVLFLPSLSRVLGAVRTLTLWGTMTLLIAFFLKHFSHDYDKKSLAYSLTLIPVIILSVSFALTLVEVIR